MENLYPPSVGAIGNRPLECTKTPYKNPIENEKFSKKPHILGEVTSVAKTGYHVTTGAENTRVFAIINNLFTPYGDIAGLENPLVGDVVELELRDGQHLIKSITARRNFIGRFDHYKDKYQGFAANVDVIFVVTSANREFSVNRIRRFLSLSGGQDIKQIIVLTKSDLCDDIESYKQQLETEFPNTKYVVLNSLEKVEVKGLTKFVKKGESVILLGSSGVGKSTIINTLCGSDIKTNDVMAERLGNKGRHTTSSRNMYYTKCGRKIIDVPGIKIVGIESAVAMQSEIFDRIATLSAGCKFRDCKHSGEPNCAVVAAVESGDLRAEELESWLQITSDS